jgi:hypothetical protein
MPGERHDRAGLTVSWAVASGPADGAAGRRAAQAARASC